MYALAFAVGSSLLSSFGQGMGAKYALQNSRYMQQTLGYAADYQEALVKIDQAKIDRLREQTISAQTAATAASGIQTGAGAPAELRAETEILSEIDKNILRMTGGIESLRYGLAGMGARAQGYSVASGMYMRGLGYSLDTASMLASRYQGAPKTEDSFGSMLETGKGWR